MQCMFHVACRPRHGILGLGVWGAWRVWSGSSHGCGWPDLLKLHLQSNVSPTNLNAKVWHRNHFNMRHQDDCIIYWLWVWLSKAWYPCAHYLNTISCLLHNSWVVVHSHLAQVTNRWLMRALPVVCCFLYDPKWHHNMHLCLIYIAVDLYCSPSRSVG